MHMSIIKCTIKLIQVDLMPSFSSYYDELIGASFGETS